MNPLLPNQQLTQAVILSLRLMFFTQAASLIFYIVRLVLFIETDLSTTPINIIPGEEANEYLIQTLNHIKLVLFLVTAITFLTWFYRAYCNAARLRKRKFRNPMWTILSWVFLPFNLYLPQQMMREIYDTAYYYLWHQDATSKLLNKGRFINWWWGTCIASVIIGAISIKLNISAQTLGEILLATFLSIFSIMISMTFIVLKIVVIRDYSRMENELFHSNTQNPDASEDLSEHLIP